MKTLSLLVLAIAACSHYSKPSPLAFRVIQATNDTVLAEQTGHLNTNNPLSELVTLSVRVKNVLIGTCVFGVMADSTLISFTGSGMDCGNYYYAWVARRQPKSPH